MVRNNGPCYVKGKHSLPSDLDDPPELDTSEKVHEKVEEMKVDPAAPGLD